MKLKLIDNDHFLSLLRIEENDCLNERLKYFSYDLCNNHIHWAFVDDKRIIGLIAIQKAFTEDLAYHIEYVSIDASFRNQGLAKQLITQVLVFCRNSNASVQVGRYSDEGHSYLEDKIPLWAMDYGVKLRQI